MKRVQQRVFDQNHQCLPLFSSGNQLASEGDPDFAYEIMSLADTAN